MGREFDFSQFATKPAKNRPDLKSNQKDMDDKAALARRLAMASWKQPAPTPAPLEAPKKQKEPEKPFEMPSAMAAKIASLQNRAPAKNDTSDDEWGE
jgi:hypothetical protein